jgi:uncharacterized protein involved in exopolysaccharide biosynthesis
VKSRGLELAENLFHFMESYCERRKLAFGIIAVGIALSLACSLAIPNVYTSTTSLLPPDNSLLNSAKLDVASLTTDASGHDTPGDLFVSILESRNVHDALIARFDLIHHYGSRRLEDARRVLTDKTSIDQNRESGVITISVNDTDAEFARDLAQGYVLELNRVLVEHSTSAAHRERLFLEERTKVVKHDLDEASQALSNYSSRSGVVKIDTQTESTINASSDLQRVLSEEQGRLAGLRQIYAEDNYKVKEIETQNAELQRQLNALRGSSSESGLASNSNKFPLPPMVELPAVGVTVTDLQRQVRVAKAIWEYLTKQKEIAQVQEINETPKAFVLDAAAVPSRKSGPRRSIIIGIAAFASFLVSCLAVAFRIRWERKDGHNEPSEIAIQKLRTSQRASVASAARARIQRPAWSRPIKNDSASLKKNTRVLKPSDHRAFDVLIFLIPCLQCIQMRIVGLLNGTDLSLLLAFTTLVFAGRLRIRSPLEKKFIILCSLWLTSQIATDLVRHSAFSDYARGWSNIAMTIVNFSVIYKLLYGRPRRIVIFGWGMVVGNFLTYLINPSDLVLADPWKFGMAFPVTFAVFLFASRSGFRGNWPAALGVLVGAINVVMGARARGGICLAAATYLLVRQVMRKRQLRNYKVGFGQKIAMSTALILGIVGILSAYQYIAEAGILGDKAREKYEAQSGGKYGVLLGGRVEGLASIPAIIDSPILGHGSWAKNPIYLMAEQRALILLGYTDGLDLSPEDLEEGLIPTHSYLLGAWVYAGILGAVFWAWIWLLTARVLLKVYPPNIVVPAAVSWFAFEMLWNILFSPYGAEVRITVPFFVVVLMGYLTIESPESTQPAPSFGAKRLERIPAT